MDPRAVIAIRGLTFVLTLVGGATYAASVSSVDWTANRRMPLIRLLGYAKM